MASYRDPREHIRQISIVAYIVMLALLLPLTLFLIKQEQQLNSRASQIGPSTLATPSSSINNPTFGVIAPCKGCVNPTDISIDSASLVPTSVVTAPAPITDPCFSDSSIATDNGRHSKHRKHNGGLNGMMEALIKFFLEFIIQVLQLLGGGPINNPNPIPIPSASPEPSTTVPNPCSPSAMPTTMPLPSIASTIAPSLLPTATLSQPPIADGFTPHAPLPVGTFKTCKPTITVDSTAAPDLDVWLKTKVVPALQAWYPVLGDTVASPDYAPRCDLKIVLANNAGGIPAFAEFTNGTITADITWAHQHPEDMGMYIHESTHIIESYATSSPEGWIVEGIADWMRDYIYKDRITKAKADVYFIDGYSEAGFLLQHMNTKYDPQFVHKLNVASHNGTYNFDMFSQISGKQPDQLWTEATGQIVPAGEIKGVGGKCLDIPNGVTVDGALLQLLTCSGTSAQRWSVAPSRVNAQQRRLTARGKCLDVQTSGTVDGTPVWLFSCNAGIAQEWIPQTNGTLLNPNSNKCLATITAGSTDGTKLEIRTCNPASPNQIWTLPK
jgi:hypothetical protein